MKRYITLLCLPLLLTACGAGQGLQIESMVPAGGISYPDDPAEPHLTNLRRLTDAGQNAEAYFSPDGQRLIFQSTMPGVTECDQQFTMTLDGQNLRMVSRGEGRTTCGYFYDGGERIVYSSTHHLAPVCPDQPDYSMGYVWALYHYDIYTMNADGSKVRKLTDELGYDGGAFFSPDGSRIVYRAHHPTDSAEIADRLPGRLGGRRAPDGARRRLPGLRSR